MGRKISQEALRKHKEESLKTLETYIDSLINDENPKIQSKADKLSFWLELHFFHLNQNFAQLLFVDTNVGKS